METREEQFQELSFYTLSLQDADFIHQHIVDAQTVQTADNTTKSIAITFSLVGLYLCIEKGFTGREVQLFHMKMAKNKKKWPRFELPLERGNITVSEVIATSPGKERDKMIRKWCEAIWSAFEINRALVIKLVEEYK